MNADIVRIRALEALIVKDVVALRDAVTRADRQRVRDHMIPMLDERDRLLGKEPGTL